jgi:hypothetical protein
MHSITLFVPPHPKRNLNAVATTKTKREEEKKEQSDDDDAMDAYRSCYQHLLNQHSRRHNELQPLCIVI